MRSKHKISKPEKDHDFFGNINFSKLRKHYFMRFLVFVITGLIFFQTAFSGETALQKHHTIKRGFNVTNLNDGTLKELKEKWNCNIVRLIVRPNFLVHVWHVNYEEAWKRFIKELPQGLDNAEKYGITVVIGLFGIPTEAAKSYPKERDAKSGAFWADENNLKVRIDCWKDIAEVCKNRKQDIWFNLFNEPLDWNDFPSYPKKWPQWAQQIINAVRKIDTTHPIVIEPGPGGLCWGYKNFPMLKDDNLIYSVHQYSPHRYTHQGVGTTKNTDLARLYLKKQQPWPGKYNDSDGFTEGGLWNKERIAKSFEPVREFQKKHNVRIFVGEFSVVRWAPNADKYLQDCLELFEEYGWDWAYHGWKESPLWSLEHVDNFDKSEISHTPTKRARVVKEFMSRNRE